MRLPTGWRSFLVSGLLCASSAAAKKDKPSVSTTSFPFWPNGVSYFDDSDVLLFEDVNDRVVFRSTDAGVTWDKVSKVPAGKAMELIMHAYDNKRAYIITPDSSHWMTNDRGDTWEEFYTDSQASAFREALTFHAKDPDRIIFNGMDCTGIFCQELTMYTTNGFSENTRFLRSDTEGCYWAVSSAQFTTGQKDLDDNRIICVTHGRFSPWRKDFRLLVSDNFFTSNGDDIQEFEPELEPGRTVQGIVNMAVVTKYLVVAAVAEGTDEMALYVSDDTIKWHRAVFPHDHKITEKAYTILESTNYSIQIDVLNTRPNNPMGVFLSSNSNGTYFTRNVEHTNRWSNGLVDFEKVAGVQGIVLVNVVDNWEDVEKNSGAKKQVKSQISFDDGRTWTGLKTKKNEKDLHLHSVTDLDNSGRVFSSPAPGIVMGIGNTGDYLKDFQDGNLYVSDDAGLTWHNALEGPHKYEFGDQGSILVAIKDEVTDEVSYSLNHGQDWDSVKLEKKVRPIQLTTTADSTSLKFLLEAIEDKQDNGEGYLIVLDFNGMHEDKCKSDDMEEWFARRVGEDDNPTCLMGHEQSYTRRKADANCFIMKEFEDPQVKSTPCDCTDADFECDYNFVRAGEHRELCEQKGNLVLSEGACKAFGPDDTFKGSSGWRLIPGNDCKRKSGAQKDDPVDRKCVDAVGDPLSGEISHKLTTFDAVTFQDEVYLERTGLSTGDDETVLMRTENGVYLSLDHGKNWEQILKDEAILAIYPHPHFNDMVFFITPSKRVFYSTDRGENIREFDAPDPPNSERLAVMSFHPKYKDWFIWTGARDCPGSKCHSVASLSQDRGDDWKTLQRYVGKCEFINDFERKDRDENLIYCEVHDEDNPSLPPQLVSSDDFFSKPPEVHFKNVVDFATMSEFIVVATKDEAHSTLKVDASVDGTTFADAEFPYGFDVDHQQAYTVLDSSTHSVFLHVTVNNEQGLEYGTIIKSNSNGTSYVLALDAVDRDTSGYVDFEKMAGVEGVAMVNVVANYDSKDYAKDGKKLKTMITHNDGAEWDYMSPPAKDADGNKFGCSGSLSKCSLHIHGYTERLDKSHVFYSQSAIGLMLGTGNVGEYLDSNSIDTFMTADGGVTWKSAKKGRYMWEFGDQGSIVVIVKERARTNMVHYTLDEGDTWRDYKFSDEEIEINDITTVPSDNSRNFLLWGYDGRKILTINLDFTGLTDVQCKLDENDVEGGDYWLWTPKHPKQDDDCLFGHVSQYHRKRTDSMCYNGRMIPRLHDIAKNCTCSRRDFECDFNYERQSDGSCALAKGYSPPDHSLVCATDESKDEWFTPTGYRRIPITTCVGGKEMDKSISHPCPGHEDKYNKKHSASGVAIFFAIIIPIVVAAGVGYWVWRNWASKFGQIRLGEQSSFDGEAPWIKYPVLVIAGVVAVVKAIPLLAASLWRSARGMMGRGSSTRFTTRDSFARGRGDYAVVDTDEGELLGEDSDEEV
ncbi:Carboxypeptidase Y receptor [Hyphodiscus hymeniophilus]|uniref:Vacuolar protein sorting/targeting protein 10 n=1 Tax=Hyphodiscus hymeniophilus TaxID=353542 RepID=A0A9P6VH32_9HELO|nr:Carboxypeptidase Y receptor [Hyphodiscus hymeniophilus]